MRPSPLRTVTVRLFQPFYRGEVRSNMQGLGVGLYIASQIAQAHGGRIDVVSEEDQSRFTFSMPLGTKDERAGPNGV